MTPELEARIESLISSFETDGPTTADTAAERAMTLYDWGNALAMDGEWIHPDLPAIAALLRPGRVERLNPRILGEYIAAMDNMIADLILVRNDPDAFGEIELEIHTPAVVNQYHSFSLTYTVGSEPIRQGGGFVVPNHFRFSDFEYQTDDPAGPNYVSISSDRDDVQFKSSSYAGSGQYGTKLRGGFEPRLFFEIAEGELVSGDRVTVVLGDQRAGSPGLRTLHYSNSALRHAIWVLTAPHSEGGLLHPLREPEIPLAGGESRGVHGFIPAMAPPGEEVTLSVRFEDRFRNRADSAIPDSFELDLNGVFWGRVETNGNAITAVPVSFDSSGVYRFEIRANDGDIIGHSDPILVEEDASQRIFWGETHSHSGWAEGLGRAEEVFRFARDESRLDFITLSEHDLWLDLGEWATMRELVDAYHDPQKFITFMGYEFTVDPPMGGHHNVLFRDPETAVLASQQRFPGIEDLYSALRSALPEKDVLVIPHAHMPGDWTRSDPGLERLVEIVSYHGTFEWFGRKYLDEGWVVGFIGSSDDHVGSPGYRPRAFGSPGSDNFGGLAAVYADNLDRDSIFDGLRNRKAYATNGNRIILQAEMNGQMMGTLLGLPETRSLQGRVIGTGPIEEITLVRNGVDLETLDFSVPREDEATRVLEVSLDFDSDPRALRPSYPDPIYRGAVQFSNAAATSARAPVSEALNSETEFVSLSDDGHSAEFLLKSGGRRVTMQFDVPREALRTGEVSIDLGASVLPLYKSEAIAPVSFSLGSLETQPYQIWLDGDRAFHSLKARLVRRVSDMDQSFEFTDASPPREGDYYYLRVRQTDGGMAWSSPWWVSEVESVQDAD